MKSYTKLFMLVVSSLIASNAYAAQLKVYCGSDTDGDMNVTKTLNIQESNNSHNYNGELGVLPSGVKVSGAFDFYPQRGLVYGDQITLTFKKPAGRTTINHSVTLQGVFFVEKKNVFLWTQGPDISASQEGLVCNVQVQLE